MMAMTKGRLFFLAQKPGRSAGPVVHGLPHGGPDNLNHGPDEGSGRIILSPVPPGIAHVLDLGLVQMGQLVFLPPGPEPEPIHQFQGVAQGIPALELALYLVKNLADLVLDGVGRGCPLFEALEVRKQLVVHKLDQIIPGHGRVIVDTPIRLFGGGPG